MSPLSSSRPLRARHAAGAGLAAVALFALTACGGGDQPAQEATPSSASATQELAPMDMAPFTLDVPSLGLELVPGSSLAVIEGDGPEYHAAWLSVPGAPAWTEEMSRRVRDHVDQYTRDTDRAADPVLDVQPRLAVVGRDIAAARLLSTERRGDRSSSASQVVWYSAREDRVLSTRDLFTEQGWADLRSEVRQRLSNDPAVVQDRLTSAVEQPDQVENARIWDGLVFLPDGSALLEVDQASIAPQDAGVLTVRIPADRVRPWLSPLGVAGQAASQSPQALVLPERLPEPSAPVQDAPDPSPSGSAPSEPALPVPAPAPSSASETAVPSAPAPGTTSAPAPTSSAPTPSAPTPSDPSTTVPGTPSTGPSGTAPGPSPSEPSPSSTASTSPTPRPTPSSPSASATAPRPVPSSTAPTSSSPTNRPTPSSPTPSAPSPSGSAPSSTAPGPAPAPTPTRPASTSAVPTSAAPVPQPSATQITASAPVTPTSGAEVPPSPTSPAASPTA
ncbi:hypothetical protein [Micrococcus sp.]|uniref:hypothetical protein n=1 Tax=Micrococcus sp. TaxID=1271 RepID=UPI002A91F1FE|nr:hypothetical protein [Micrococcus sp.]MDY6055251.1 hypothetical protein [Micrococcus sp.]